MKNAYIIFSKIPSPGFVKTRLISDYTAKGAAQIQSQMLIRLINMSIGISKFADIYFAYRMSDDSLGVSFLNILPNEIHTFIQSGNSIGEKMSNAIKTVQGLGYQEIILTGSDIPQLTEGIIHETFEHLAESEMTLGPTYDGGYYLIGVNDEDPYPYLNADISWSTSSVFETTKKLIEMQNKQMYLAPKLYDIDYKSDLESYHALIGRFEWN